MIKVTKISQNYAFVAIKCINSMYITNRITHCSVEREWYAHPIIHVVRYDEAHLPGSCRLCQGRKTKKASVQHVYVAFEDCPRGLDQGDQTAWPASSNLIDKHKQIVVGKERKYTIDKITCSRFTAHSRSHLLLPSSLECGDHFVQGSTHFYFSVYPGGRFRNRSKPSYMATTRVLV